MFTCHYEKEPLDLRLLLLRLWRQAGIIILVTLLGTLVFGGGYYLKNIGLAPKQYAAMSLYQVEYKMDPISHLEYTYINGETWKRWMITEEFLDLLYANLEGTADAGIDRAVMKTYLSAELLTDLRMPDTIVTTSDPALTLRLAAAVEASMVDFAAGQQGIDNIRVVDPAVETWVHNESRPLNACILSALLSFLFITAILLIKELSSDSLWLPVQVRKRFGVKTVAVTDRESLMSALRYLLQEKTSAGVMAVSEESDCAALAAELKKLTEERKAGGAKEQEAACAAENAAEPEETRNAAEIRAMEWIPLPDPELCPEVYGQLLKLDALVLAVPAGAGRSRRLEEVLAQLELYDRTPDLVLLTDVDETLLRWYYFKQTLLGMRGKE